MIMGGKRREVIKDLRLAPACMHPIFHELAAEGAEVTAANFVQIAEGGSGARPSWSARSLTPFEGGARLNRWPPLKNCT